MSDKGNNNPVADYASGHSFGSLVDRHYAHLTETPTGRTLVKKLAKVMAIVESIPKTGYNAHHKYDYATERDITAAVRHHLAEQNVFVFPSVVSSEVKGDITYAKVKFTLEDGDSGEKRECIIEGAGQDKGDKGLYKAYTGATKYFLLKAFLMPTGDDPETEVEAKAPKTDFRKKPEAGPPSKPASHDGAKGAEQAPPTADKPTLVQVSGMLAAAKSMEEVTKKVLPALKKLSEEDKEKIRPAYRETLDRLEGKAA